MPGPKTSLSYPIAVRELDNGLRVQVNEDHSSPSVAVNLWYNVGSRHEQPGRTGFAHLFEHLMFQGSAHVEAAQHMAILEAAGASANATTSFDRTNYFETGPSATLDLSLWLEADRMATLLDALTQDNLNNQREVVKEEKRQRYDNAPYGRTIQHMLALAFPEDHPYHHPTIGSMAHLDAASTDDVREFFTTHYMPNNAVLTIAGDITVDEAWSRAEHFFGPVAPRTPPPRLVTSPLPALEGFPRLDLEEPVPADAVYLCWRLPQAHTDAHEATELALDILGGDQTSRLHRVLVRERQLAEVAGAGSIGLVGGNSLGYVVARAREGVDLATLEAALVEVIADFATEGPTVAELARTRAQAEREHLQELASIARRADLMSGYATLCNDPTLINWQMDRILAIPLHLVAAAAATHLQPTACATLAYHSTMRKGA